MELGVIIKKVVEIATDIVANEAVEVDREERWVTKSMEALKDARLTGLMVPTESGGLGPGALCSGAR